MQVFYAPGIKGKVHILGEKESGHCIRVLRMKKNTPVKLIDGRGNLYEGFVSVPDPKGCEISITGITADFERRPYKLHIAISPLKNPERFEWFIEKSVEIGIDEITPLICRNSEKKSVKPERINNIIVSAMKQSLKTVLTSFNDPVEFSEFVTRKNDCKKIISHCSARFDRRAISDLYVREDDALILIGPEGDFSDDEISLALNNGFKSAHLGKSRLRTETAGIAACHSIYFMNQ
jgi:16S rRNA (uracil1498-N3)-methyltransferase